MANKKPNPATRFKPGESGNLNGRPAVDPEVKRIKKFTAEELETLITTLLNCTEEERDAIQADPAAPMIKKIIASILNKTHETGNMAQLDMVLNRVIGKVKEKIEHSGLEPSILIKRDGTQVQFGLTKKQSDEEE